MARARRQPEETEEQNGTVLPSETRQMPSKNAYKGILSSFRAAKKDVSEIAGTLSGEIKAFIDKWKFNRKAIRHLSEMDRMEPENLRDYLECIDHGRDVYGLNERAAAVQPMQFGEDENVVEFEPPESVAAE